MEKYPKLGLKNKNYVIRLVTVMAPGPEGAQIVENARDLKVRGAVISYIPGAGVDYLQIKDAQGYIVFTANMEMVQYCVEGDRAVGEVRVLDNG